MINKKPSREEMIKLITKALIKVRKPNQEIDYSQFDKLTDKQLLKFYSNCASMLNIEV